MRVMGCDDWANSRSRKGLVGGEVIDQLGEREWRVGVGDVCWRVIHFSKGVLRTKERAEASYV